MSKFDKIFEAREEKEKDFDQKIQITQRKKNARSKTEKTPTSINAQPIIKKRGRPKAKRSNPEFIGLTTYIRKETHLNVKIALLKERQKRELSELVEELLSDWLLTKKL